MSSSHHNWNLDEGFLDVNWVMPTGFFELPMEAESVEEITEQLIRLAQEVLPNGTPDMQYQWAAMCGANYDAFVEGSVQYAGFVATEVDDKRCTATVHVSLMDLAEETRKDPIQATMAALKALNIGEVREISLPCGPAVSCIGSRRAALTGALTPSGNDEPFWTSFIQVQIPLSNGTAAVFELATPTQEGWDVFSSMFAGVVKSVRIFAPAEHAVEMST
ncbi:hypothetical protein [Streptomyces sp. bgisy100]|uniref:hypothetical protein n=1 Tax=Streptomyces sp. bgisy100 TaxID=3413783 RepID=UPI003D715DCA